MTDHDPMVAHARVDAELRLIEADPRVLVLQTAAGGAIGTRLVVPALASIARLARSLGIVVSRGLTVGSEDGALDLWVRAQADGSDIRLAISGWKRRSDRPYNPGLAAERERSFAALADDGLWSCDARLRWTSVDPDLDPSSVGIGQPLMALIRLLTDDDGELPLVEAIATLEPFAGQPAALRAAPDAVLFLQGEPIRDGQGGFAGFSGSFRWQNRPGVAEAKASEAPRPAQTLMPPRIDRALRMPLDRIIRSADAIAARDDGPLRHDYAAYASDIAAASRHLLGLVDDLGDVQAIEAKSFQIETEVIDLSDIIRRAAGLLRVRAADRNVRIDTSDAEYPASATGDYRRVMQILVNLVGNAVRYAPEGSSVWVRVEDEDDLIAIIVADQGQGIAVENQARIFEKFERVNPDEPGGTGLGLFISRALARAMGGDITVDSAPGQGARFVLTLPRDAV